MPSFDLVGVEGIGAIGPAIPAATFSLSGAAGAGQVGAMVPDLANSFHLIGVAGIGRVGSLLVNISPNNPSSHQAFSQFLYLGARLVDPNTGIIEPPWDRFFNDIWRRSGGGTSMENMAFLKVNGNALSGVVVLTGVEIPIP